MKYFKKTGLLFFILFLSVHAFSQSDNCVLATSQLLTAGAAGAACSPTAGSTSTGFTDSNQGCTGGTEDDDGWFRFVATATSHTITVDGDVNMDAVLGVYSNCTGTVPAGGTCVDATIGNGLIETCTVSGLTIGNTYYISVHDWYAGGGEFTICVTTPSPPPSNDGCGSATSITPGALGAACSPTSGSSLTATLSGQGCVTGNEDDDVWYAFTATQTSHTVTVDGASNMDAVLGVYSTCAGAQPTGGACVDATGANGNETVTVTGLTVGVTYLICIYDFAAGGGDFTVCVTSPYPSVNMSNTTTTSCGTTFLDNGGTGNYTNSQNLTHTFCPAVAGQCVSATFSSMNIETGYDYLYVYDGNSTAASQFSGSPFTGTTTPGPFTGTITNTTGCLTFRFTSDGSFNYSGFTAAITCATCNDPSVATSQDCAGGSTICSNTSFSGNSSGGGNYSDFTAANTDCLDPPEHQTSWYYFSSSTNGTVGMTVTPGLTTDDYDWAIWGPMATVTCPPSSAPIRCSAADGNGTAANITGLGNGAVDLTEGSGGNGWVSLLNVLAGEVYILVMDNWTASSSPFTLSWQLSNGATLDCAPLPIELVSFTGLNEGTKNKLEWITASEKNNDFFSLEHSSDGSTFETFYTTDGAGNSFSTITYQAYDFSPYKGTSYYRLKQTDYNGAYTYSSIIAIDNKSDGIEVSNLHPNPTNSDLNFDFYSSIKGEILIQVIDYTGRIVLGKSQQVEAGKSRLITQMEELIPGMYTLKVSMDKKGYTAVSKVIKK